MFLPKDSNMLLSVINTYLRDKYSSLNDLCDSEDVDYNFIIDSLKGINYFYDEKANQFINK